jgi:hypothetical protein
MGEEYSSQRSKKNTPKGICRNCSSFYGWDRIEVFIEDHAFAFVRFGYSPTPSPTLPIARPATHRKTEKERQVADGRGGKRVGEEPNHATARKPGPL